MSDDPSALAWVAEEIHQSLEQAQKSLRKALKQASDVDDSPDAAADSLALRASAEQFHQAAGALELATLAEGARVLRANEMLIGKWIIKPQLMNEEAVKAIEALSFAVMDFIRRKIAGKLVSAVALFPQYEAVMAHTGVELPRPADLWQPAISVSFDRALFAALPTADAVEPDEAALSTFESGLLPMMRQGGAPEAQDMSALLAGLSAQAALRGAHREANTWALASAFLQGLANERLLLTVHTKRVLSQLLSQVRATVRHQQPPSERLFHDLMFFCSQALPLETSSAEVPATVGVLDAVRQALALTATPAVDLSAPTLGLFDPALIALALKRVASAKDGWSAVAAGDALRLNGLSELFVHVGDSLRRLCRNGDVLALALTEAAAESVKSGQAPSPLLAMEVATSLLYLEASWQDDSFTQAQEIERLQRLADRIEQARDGREPAPLEAWIEELYRRVSDQQTMGTVVKELRTTLSESEKSIDAFFRDPAQRGALMTVPAQLKSMKGVFSLLDVPEANHALGVMHADIDILLQSSDAETIQVTQERLATNVSALGFLVNLLGVQPFAAKSLFAFDEATGLLTSRVSRAASEVPELALLDIPALPEASMVDLSDADLELPASTLPALPRVDDEAAQDTEMLDIFVEEAHEVLDEAQQASGTLLDQPDDINVFITLRRAFHTLKGSSRMVGMTAYGEAAWACEQLYNAWIASQAPANATLEHFTNEALAHLAQGLGEIEVTGATQTWDATAMIEAAHDLRLQERWLERSQADTTAAFTSHEPGSEELHDELPDALPGDMITLDLSDEQASEVFHEQGMDIDFETSELESFLGTDQAPFDAGLQTQEVTELPELSEVPELAQAPEPLEDVPLTALSLGNQEAVERVSLATSSANDEAADEQYKLIGPLRISIPLFNIYLNEADEQSRRLSQMLAEWSLEHHRTLSDEPLNLAHSLAGNSAAVGFTDLSALSRLLEHALMKAQALGAGETSVAALFVDAADEIRRLLHQFAAGFLKTPSPELMACLQKFEQDAAQTLDARHLASDVDMDLALPEPASSLSDAPQDPVSAPLMTLVPAELKTLAALDAAAAEQVSASVQLHRVDLGLDADIDAVDAIDPDLFPIFEEEALELLPQLHGAIRQWLKKPDHREAMDASMRTLHTFKGGARLLGAMRLGELAHRMEADVEQLAAQDNVAREDIETLLVRADVLQDMFDALVKQNQHGFAEQATAIVAVPAMSEPEPEPDHTLPPILNQADELPASLDAEQAKQAALVNDEVSPGLSFIDWANMSLGDFRPTADAQTLDGLAASALASVRVKPRLLDRLVNQAGEVSISRARLADQVQQMRGSVGDLTDNMARLREQLREIELQAETQLSTRMEAARSTQQEFDPLEFDRYTRFQELTRMMAESVNDVAALQTGLVRNLEAAEDHLVAQARLTRELQDDLLRTRMVAFDGLTDRLYRVIRQASKETGKQVRLDIVGGQTEIDRGVLDRMTGAFEHLLRNCVTHGIEMPDERVAQDKPAMGSVVIAVKQAGNEVSLTFRDDGAGLDLDRIRAKAIASGLLPKDAPATDAELAQLIFTPGFSTAEKVTELAGRGIGMDVVRTDVTTMGGRIETATAQGQGTSFNLMLPLTTAVTKVVMVRCGDLLVAIPTDLVELVRRVPTAEVLQAYDSGLVSYADQVLPFFWMGALLQHSPRGAVDGRSALILIIRSAQQRVALHVDEVLGNQDVVVKNLGPQLSRVPGLAGMTMQASGAIALIYNPVALAAVYGVQAQQWTGDASVAGALATTPTNRSPSARAPLVLVVDDSLTVRRVTQRLLTREGYRVILAKDGLDALEKMAVEVPVVVLSDIEMPRMNGFDLVRNLRANPDWAHLPVVMITSRIAQKHRDYAMELGANHYLGKPYSEEELLSLVARYVPGLDFTTA